MAYEIPQKRCRLKGKKPSQKNKPKINDNDREYLDWLQHQQEPCFQCGTFDNIEWHHVKEYSFDSKKHEELIPLCIHHHTGHTLSPHGTPRQWRNMYHIEVQREEARRHHDRYVSEKVTL